MSYVRDSSENAVHLIVGNGAVESWIPISSDSSVWATEDDYPDDIPSNSNSSYQSQTRPNGEQPPNKKSRNSSQDVNSKSKAIGKMFFKTKLCCKFRSGTCPYISNCNFAHSIEELRRPPPNWQEIVAAHEEEKGSTTEIPREEFQIPSIGSTNFTVETQRSYKGRHCKKFYTEEGCPYGENCTFVHDEQNKNRESVAISLGPGGYGGGAAAAIAATSVGVSNVKPSNWKTRICNKWELTGYCPFGSKCHFAHGVRACSPFSYPESFQCGIEVLCTRIVGGQNSFCVSHFSGSALIPELHRFGGSPMESENKESAAVASDTKQTGVALKTPVDTVVASVTSASHADIYHVGVGVPSQRSSIAGERSSQRSHHWKGPDKISRIYGDWIDDIE